MPHPALASLLALVEGVKRRRRMQHLLAESALTLLVAVTLALLFAIVLALLPALPGLPLALFAILVIVVGYRIRRQTVRWREVRTREEATAQYVEERLPGLDLALLTSIEEGGRSGVEVRMLAERLWRETESLLERERLRGAIERLGLRRAELWPLAALPAVLLLLLGASRGWQPLGQATLALLTPWSAAVSSAPSGAGTPFDVAPGDITVERGSDVMVIARLAGPPPARVHLNVQTDRLNWTRIAMQQEAAGESYSYYLRGVDGQMRYYVSSGDLSSRQYLIRTFDLPRVERIEASYRYPAYMRLGERSEIEPWEIQVPEGTRVVLVARTNTRVSEAGLRLERSGEQSTVESIPVTISGDDVTASFEARAGGRLSYMLRDREGLDNPAAGEIHLRVVPDAPPAIVLREPGSDRDVMPLDEVVISARASDDFGLTEFALTYEVVGREPRRVDLLEERLATTHDGEQMLYLEDLGVLPGDFVSYFFTAADNREPSAPARTVSDIYFLEVVPTSAAFRRGEGTAGMGGSGGTSSAAVRRQKDIIAATWKLRNRDPQSDPGQYERDAATITDSQQQVMQRTLMSLQRLLERQSFADESYDRAVDHMGEAVKQMERAVALLSGRDIADALEPEQAALQALLKAEANSRERQVMVRRGGERGGERGGASDGRRERDELRELFDMEVGQLQNRYETPNQGSGPKGANAREVDALKELARRQEHLEQAQRRLARSRQQLAEEQRRRALEQLEREQEELTRQTRELADEMGGRGEALERIARQMESAAERLSREGDPELAAANSRKIRDQLREQAERLRREGVPTTAGRTAELGQRGRDLREREKAILLALERLVQEQEIDDYAIDMEQRRRRERLVDEKSAFQEELRRVERAVGELSALGDEEDDAVKSAASELRSEMSGERLGERIDTSIELVRQGMLNISYELEREIAESIDRLADGLIALDRSRTDGDRSELQRAAADATELRRLLEQAEQAAMEGGDDGIRALRERIERSRTVAGRLARRGRRGQLWSADARIISGRLDQLSLAEFLNRPALLQQLLAPVIALENKLTARAEIERMMSKVLLSSDEEIPPEYEKLVETYYKSLSETARSGETR